MKKVIAILFFLLAAFAVIFYFLYPALSKKPAENITNFQQCAAAGYPVMESYPRQCSLPNGRFFVEQTMPER